jgi:hypothetical protein
MAIRNALESYRVFISASSKVENFQLSNDLIQDMISGHLKNIQVIGHTEKGRTICHTIECTVSPEDIANAIREEIIRRTQQREEKIPKPIMVSEPKPLSQEYSKIKIPERTVIPVRLIQHLKGGRVNIGQCVDFEVARDIIIDNFLVIKHGAPAYGDITASKRAGYVSRGGKIGLNIDYCKAMDGSKIYLKSILHKEEESHVGANVAASVLLCPLILVAKGEEAELLIGTEFKAYVKDDVFVKMLAIEKLTDRDIHETQQRAIEERKRLEKERIEKEKREKEKKEQEEMVEQMVEESM